MIKLIKLLMLAGISLAVFFSCDIAADKAASQGDRKKSQSLIFQLNWIPDPTFTGEYLAKGRGFWEKEGVDVSIRPGGIGIDPITLLLSGKAHFAVVGSDKAVLARSNGAKIKILGVDFQRNPVGWIAREELGVKSLRDIKNRQDVFLGDKVGTETTSIMELCLKKLNLKDKIVVKGVGFDFSFFMKNANAVYPVYLNEEPVMARLKGLKIVEIDPSKEENGNVNIYGNVVVASEKFLKENPGIAPKVMKGLQQGWSFALEHENEALAVLKEMIDYNSDAIGEVMKRSVSYATNNGSTVLPGTMDSSRWRETIENFIDAGIVDKTFNFNELFVGAM